MIPPLASLFAVPPETVESGPGVYTHTVYLPQPLGVRFASMDLGIARNGRLTITGTVKVKGGYARIARLGLVRRMSRGMRRHVRRVKAGRRG